MRKNRRPPGWEAPPGAGSGDQGLTGSGGGIRTPDLWVMSPTSCRCSTPRHTRAPRRSDLAPRPSHAPSGHLAAVRWGAGAPAAASPPVGSPPQYSPALRRVTTGFGMGPGGAGAPSATGTPAPPPTRAPEEPVREETRARATTGRVCCVLHCRTGVRPAPDTTPRRRCPRGSPLAPGSQPPATARTTPSVVDVLARCGSVRSQRLRSMRGLPSAISTARLRSVTRRPPAACPPGRLPGALPCEPGGGARLEEGFPLRCFQRLARPDVATRQCSWRNNRHTSGPSVPVLSY